MKLSARNQLKGKVVSIEKGAVNGIVGIELKGGDVITSTISLNSINELGLEVGKEAYSVIKATSVMVGVDHSEYFVRTIKSPHIGHSGVRGFLYVILRLAVRCHDAASAGVDGKDSSSSEVPQSGSRVRAGTRATSPPPPRA